jgi:glycosyltransferase involved in cell wall biosynthesis
VRFSVIIPTIHRIKETMLMLESLTDQTFTGFEVLLIDQNEKDILKEPLTTFNRGFSFQQIRTDVKGASNARNLGIEKADGEILLFPDDDCEFHQNYLEEINTYFNETRIDGIITTTKDKLDGKAISIFMASKAQKIKRVNILETVIEAGIIIKASKLQGVYFDPKMGVGSPVAPYWSDEGPDLVLRLLEKGVQFNYCPQFYMFHPNPVKIYNEKTALRSYRYGKGRGYFLRKHQFGLTNIIYYLCIYIIGMLKGIVCFNKQMFLYFKQGFKGRYEGYFSEK